MNIKKILFFALALGLAFQVSGYTTSYPNGATVKYSFVDADFNNGCNCVVIFLPTNRTYAQYENGTGGYRNYHIQSMRYQDEAPPAANGEETLFEWNTGNTWFTSSGNSEHPTQVDNTFRFKPNGVISHWRDYYSTKIIITDRTP